MNPTPETKYTKREHEDNDSVSVALIQQDIRYMRTDISDIKADIRAASYVTRDQMLEIRAEWEARYQAINRRVNAIYTYGGVVLGVFTTALIGAFLKLTLKI